ncbi:DUF885 domain-containing protein [Aurantiacibacter sp. MUD61]|uniref:DUF885 domain-containing protein n=1 Tax=Aurantiacibacter sp. MUD61 TaxID=3009083 RepID=UPI0022F0C4A3|nr:DUF885 domain-containing protein [Aurantiacibacter sp. MUD61]
MLRLALAALAATTAITTIQPTPVEAQDMQLPEGEVDRMMAMQMLALLAEDPETISSLGIIPPGGPDSPYARLTSQGAERFAQAQAMSRRFYEQASALDRASLPEDQQLSLDIWLAYLSASIAVDETGLNGSPYVVDQFWVQDLPRLFLRTHQLNSPFMAEAWVQRMEQVGDVVAEREALFEAEAARGVLPPQIIIDNVIADIDAVLEPAPDQHPMYLRLVADMPEDIAEDEAEALRARALAAITDGFYPAYRSMQDALRGHRDHARTENVGILGLPDGEEQYIALARRWTTTDIDPEAVHQRGLEEVARIRGEMDRRLTALGFTEGTFEERMAAAYQEGLYGYPNSEEGAEALLARTEQMVDDARRITEPYFTRFPEAPVETIPVPVSAQASAPNSYSRPAADGSRPGVFNINLADPSRYGDISYPSLVYHETIPGHHYQIALQQETDLPLVRRFLPFSAYSEGWGLYVETIAEDMGLYEENPIGVLGALSSELFRAARLVVDTGIHHQGWSREEAQEYMEETVGDPSVREVDRYIVWPGQALAYKTGQLVIADLRADAEERLGDDFDVALFHDEILREGSMPLSVLETQIGAWIAAQEAELAN